MPNDPNKTYVFYANDLEFGGKMPEIGIKNAIKDIGMMIHNIRNWMPVFYE